MFHTSSDVHYINNLLLQFYNDTRTHTHTLTHTNTHTHTHTQTHTHTHTHTHSHTYARAHIHIYINSHMTINTNMCISSVKLAKLTYIYKNKYNSIFMSYRTTGGVHTYNIF